MGKNETGNNNYRQVPMPNCCANCSHLITGYDITQFCDFDELIVDLTCLCDKYAPKKGR